MALALLLMFLGMLVPILLFSWWMRRTTGYDPRGSIESDLPFRRRVDFHKRRDFYAPEQQKEREKKENPHYDALVDAEWKATKRLEEASAEDVPTSDEVHTLSELLEQKDKDL